MALLQLQPQPLQVTHRTQVRPHSFPLFVLPLLEPNQPHELFPALMSGHSLLQRRVCLLDLAVLAALFWHLIVTVLNYVLQKLIQKIETTL